MIKKIAHMGDIHIKKSIDRHEEYREVFDKLYKDLKKEKPDRIVVAGDVYDNFIDIEGESLVLVGEFLTNLSIISKTILIVGNHDIRKKHKTRINTIETVTTLLNNPEIIYYNKTGFYEDDNVVWVVWDHVDGLNPWKDINHNKSKDKIYIDIYHDPIDGCSLYNGMRFEGKYPKIKDFKGDYSMFGDIHLRQFFDYQYTEKEINENELDKYIKDGWEITKYRHFDMHAVFHFDLIFPKASFQVNYYRDVFFSGRWCSSIHNHCLKRT